ncbi:hypothetical protein LCGC14_0164670 [marine sediment metagenome]|uniref:Uncharacterized protein n=1 Tax=marine sediment metagenome TaxID=412755 RepID=A0A0F9XWP2_9ZZZZ
MTTALQETVLEVLDPRLLLEMGWEDLIGFQADDEEIGENLEALYELEYKYSMLRTKPFEGVPQRRERMLERLEAIAYPLAESLARQILVVYEEWLSGHAIGDPKEWAATRVREAEEIDLMVSLDSLTKEAIEAAWSEYDRYVLHGGGPSPYNQGAPKGPDTSEIAQAARAGMLPSLMILAETLMEEENEQMAGEEDFEPYDDPADYLEVTLDSYGSLGALVEGLDWDYVDADPSSFLRELYQTFVFPVWWDHWQPLGIEATRERIEDGVEVLEKIEADAQQFPMQQLFGKLNEIVNLTHQTGGMADYLEGRYSIDATLLQELSDRDTSDWDEELQELGVQMNGPDTQGDAEAAERAGPAPA